MREQSRNIERLRHIVDSIAHIEDREVCDAVQMPGMHSREEMMELSKQRMQDILSEREQTLSHEDVMQLVDNAIAKAV